MPLGSAPVSVNAYGADPPEAVKLAAYGLSTTPAGKAVGATATVGQASDPDSEKVPLKVGPGAPPTMSVPTRSQSGLRLALRIQVCRSPENGVPGASIGLGADSHKKCPEERPTCGTKK